jgi:hypothetical protein
MTQFNLNNDDTLGVIGRISFQIDNLALNAACQSRIALFLSAGASHMALQNSKPEWLALANALNLLRDSLTLFSLRLKDHIAEAPSEARDEVIRQVDLRLAAIFDANRRTL